MPALTALLAVGFVLIHLFIGRLRLLDVVPRSRWLSFAGGVAVAYIFLHILPELGAHQRTFAEELGIGARSAEAWVYLIALAGLAAVRVLEQFEVDPEWRARPGKVVLRARSPSQWARVLEEPHAAASDGVVALPPRRRSQRGEALTKLQAMSTELEPPPET